MGQNPGTQVTIPLKLDLGMVIFPYPSKELLKNPKKSIRKNGPQKVLVTWSCLRG